MKAPTIAAAMLALAGAAATAAPAGFDPPPPERRQALVRIVRQDCGSCHGMRLTGGLGPALTREALADKPMEMVLAVVRNGRPGTPMPPWRSMLSDADMQWIAQQLLAGFPAESTFEP